jgi:hypothetical protein
VERGRIRGGIAALLELIEEHRPAFEYDWRSRFHVGLDVVGDEMGWGETIRLAGVLSADPGSQLWASLHGWRNPASRAELVLMDLWDITFKAAGPKKWTPYPRPFDLERDLKARTGSAGNRTPQQVMAILADFGHPAPPV